MKRSDVIPSNEPRGPIDVDGYDIVVLAASGWGIIAQVPYLFRGCIFHFAASRCCQEMQAPLSLQVKRHKEYRALYVDSRVVFAECVLSAKACLSLLKAFS